METGADTVENSMEVSKKLRIESQDDPAISLLGTYPKNLKTFICKDIRTPMFTAALFTVAKTWKQLKCPSAEDWIKNMWHVYTMEYYSAIRKDEMLPCATTWVDLKNIILSEVSQAEKSRTI